MEFFLKKVTTPNCSLSEAPEIDKILTEASMDM